MRLSAALALMALGVAVSGCATIIDGSSEKIGITTGSVTGAHCVLSNGRGQWSVVTPGKVTVERSKHDMKVTCSKQGYQDVAATIPSDIDGWTLVNFAFVNLPGLGVDAWTGAINDYDDTTTVHMSQGYGAEPAYPSYPSQPDYPPVQQQTVPQTPPPAYLDSSPYPAPTQPMNDQPQSYPDNSYPDNSQSYPDNSQSAPGSLPPL
jgi:uncharacterized protein YceK